MSRARGRTEQRAGTLECNEVDGKEATVVAVSSCHGVEHQLDALRRKQSDHALWSSPLLTAFAQGTLSKHDLQYVFSQYLHYSASFTRYIAAVMANCDSDLFRARLSENLWDEGGGCDPDRRHAQIFRRFLQRSLGVEPDGIEYEASTRQFVRECLATCLRAEPVAGAAFLSLGTEGIVPRLYQIMLAGLRTAGIPDDELEFFHIHIACDDEHTRTLENMMTSYSHVPGWFDTCLAAMTRALDLRAEFFASIFDTLQHRRLNAIMSRMQARKSLAHGISESGLHHQLGGAAQPLYDNRVDKLNIQFTVERLPLAAEVLDPRIVRIPAGKFNEKHKHAHETLIHILEGSGQVSLDDRVIAVHPGDTILVPRWALHQTQNLGASEMRFLAVTDFNLTRSAYLGDAIDYRMNADDAQRP
jgi:pyrroloquinoline quinone (PQQ) biosynthesis protein C/quercetin dioxygenase-like cupin family protein